MHIYVYMYTFVPTWVCIDKNEKKHTNYEEYINMYGYVYTQLYTKIMNKNVSDVHQMVILGQHKKCTFDYFLFYQQWICITYKIKRSLNIKNN